MDTLYQAILDLLNGLIPEAQLSTWGNFNEFLAYVTVIVLIYTFLFYPLKKLLGKVFR